MIGRRLTLLLCCATLCWAQDNWEWPCDNVTAQEGVHISQMFGRWYLAAEMAPQLNRIDTCLGMEFASIDHSNSSFTMSVYLGNNGSFTRTKTNTANVIAPSKWQYDRFPVVVVALPSDGGTLALTTCTNTTEADGGPMAQMTMVLSKSKAPVLGPVYDHLRTVGVLEHEGAVAYNLQLCPKGFM